MPSETRFIRISGIEEVQDMLSGVSGRRFNQAMQAAISRTLDPTAKKMFSDRVKDTINLPVAEIKRQVSVKKPSYTKLEGSITMSRKPVPLIRYMSVSQFNKAQTLKTKVKGKQTRFRQFRVGGGITAKVRKDRPVEKFPSAFIAPGKGGYIGVFQRVRSKGGKNPLVPRKPIRLMQGPTAVGILANAPGKNAATIIDEIVGELGPILQKNVASQIDRLLHNEKSFG